MRKALLLHCVWACQSSLLCRVPNSSPCSLAGDGGRSQRAWTLRQAKKETCSLLWETDGPQDGGWVLWNLVRDGPKWTGKIQASRKSKMFLKTEQIGKWVEFTSRGQTVETSRGGEGNRPHLNIFGGRDMAVLNQGQTKRPWNIKPQCHSENMSWGHLARGKSQDKILREEENPSQYRAVLNGMQKCRNLEV